MKPVADKTSPYIPVLDLRQTERAIRTIKEFFQINLAESLNLLRVSAPLFVMGGTGINDDLNGIEKPISFAVKAINEGRAEIVQSLAKWKRMALADYGFQPGEGLYTDMNAIRPDEILDSIHSVYVDQWDWERVMADNERNLAFLRGIVERIYGVVYRTEQYVAEKFPQIKPFLPSKIEFIHSEELERRWPDLAPPERENKIAREAKAVFIIGIGGPLADGKPHDGRAPDYDDWSTATGNGHGLNGDIIVWNPVLNRGFELSSMGIRVNPEALKRQLEVAGFTERAKLLFHRRLLNGELPQTIGGGIGQSRLCMLFLQKLHIGEVQCSVWPMGMRDDLKRKNVILL
ncbi:MAG: aspartate--ammonia ligase [Acidobacteria bacterium]|nr:aspartate--ammonia ligase [Acidobacteriota bacterium]